MPEPVNQHDKQIPIGEKRYVWLSTLVEMARDRRFLDPGSFVHDREVPWPRNPSTIDEFSQWIVDEYGHLFPQG